MKLLKSLLCVAALAAATSVQAQVYAIDAQANSITGGTGLSTVTLGGGQSFTLTANPNDLWSAGALPRYSDANGLIAPRFATASDDSGQPVGTQIGDNFGLVSVSGFSAPFGSLVGLVGSQYQLLGTNFSGSFASAGTLQLFYWDSNNSDNFGTVSATLRVAETQPGVPEPGTWLMMLAGFGAVGTALRRRRQWAVLA